MEQNIERAFLYYLIENKDLSSFQLVDVTYFTKKGAQYIYGLIEQFYEINNYLPSWEGVLIEAKHAPGFSKKDRETLRRSILSLKSYTPSETFDFYVKKIVSEKKRRDLSETVEFVQRCLDKGDYEIAEEVLKNCSIEHITEEDDDVIIDYVKEVHRRYDSDFEEKTVVKTGIKPLDEAMFGGLHLGEVLFFLGVGKSGKSMFLQNIAANALRQGIKTLFFTNEMRAEEVQMRWDAHFSGIEFRAFRNQEDFRQIFETGEAKKKILENSLPEDTLFIKQAYPGMSCKYFKSYYKKLNKDVKLILIDYANLVGSNNEHSENSLFDWRTIAVSSAEMKQLALQTNTVVITACQMQPQEVENQNPNMTSIAFGKGGPVANADAMWAIVRTKELEAINKVKLSFMFGRMGSCKNTILLPADYNRILVGTDEENDGEDYVKEDYNNDIPF